MKGVGREQPLQRDPLDGTRYRALSELGQGGLGVVYEAEDRRTRQRVAVKLLRPGLPHELRQRAERESEHLERLTRIGSPHIVKRLDSGVVEGGTPFIVMERLEGPTLATLLAEQGPFPLQSAMAIVLQVLRGLTAIHEQSIVHRDLKLDNIVLETQVGHAPLVKLLDFGCAKEDPATNVRTALTSKGTVIGTPRYLSPEQATGQTADARSDLYTVGYILYTLVTGRLPFEHLEDSNDLLVAHAIHPIELPSQVVASEPIPPELDRIVEKALSKEPEDRFQTALEFARALSRVEQATRKPVGWMETTGLDPADLPHLHGGSRSGPLPLKVDADWFASAPAEHGNAGVEAASPSVAGEAKGSLTPSLQLTSSRPGRRLALNAKYLIFSLIAGASTIGAAALIAWTLSQGGWP